jgi:histone-lysine N-methyltransferase SUV420H
MDYYINRHLRRYLLPLTPTSRLEIHTTARYTSVSGHTELAVFATRNLPPGAVLQELQGSVVPLPDEWREEMEIGEDFAIRAAGEESEEEESDYEADHDEVKEESEEERSQGEEEEDVVRRQKGKGKERESERPPRGARRSDRTKRRDFSIVWSGLKRCYQLFLGPARFLNVSV